MIPEARTRARAWRLARGGVRVAAFGCLACELFAWVYGAWADDRGVVAAALTHLPPALWIVPPLLTLAAALGLRQFGSVLLAGAGLVVGSVPLGGFSLRFSREPGPHPISVVTFNVEQWSHGAEAVSNVVLTADADVFCLQEAGDYDYVPRMAEQRRILEARLGRYRWLRSGEIAIGSRLPLVRTNDLPLPPGLESRPLLEVVLQGPDGREFSVLAAHLVYTSYFALSPNGLERAARARLQQAERISTYVEKLGHPAVLCGDLNAGFRSASVLRLTSVFRDAWRERGFGFGLTFSTALRTRRLDYLLSRGLEVDSIRVLAVEASDHYPLLSVMEFPSVSRVGGPHGR